MSEGRNERFVRTARRLLLFQVGAAALATGLAGWAALEITGLVRERDSLAARVAELEARPVTGAYPPDYVEPLAPVPGTATAPTPAQAPPPSPPTTAGTPPAPPPPPPSPAPSPPPAPPPSPPPAPPPPPPPAPPPPAPPPPARECQSVQRQPIVCVPPFRRTPVPGVCVDGNNRPMRCPPGTPRPTKDEQRQPQQQRPAGTQPQG